MADQMKLALRGALLSAAADGVTDGAVDFVDAVVDTFRAENERLLEEAFDMGVDMTAMRDEIKRLRKALEKIQDGCPPDGWTGYDKWGDPAGYYADGRAVVDDPDMSNMGDIGEWGWWRGRHYAAIIARKALEATDA